ncbi:unnamed protein product [Diabrotica balteata]|uniref:Uncharacterized protein n=1 Tax=Diabrotica balteata TaxID=107213 RepID=A0A9N9T0N3_DIABA|nr:unnamed protein product [Diabrotica balteata]
MSKMTEYEDLSKVKIRDLITSTLFENQDSKSELTSKVQRRYSGLFTPLKSTHNAVIVRASIGHFDEHNPPKNDFPDGTRITRRMSAFYNCDDNKLTENKVEETEKINLATRKDKTKISDTKRYLRRKSCSDVNKTSEENHSSPIKDTKIKEVKNIKKAVRNFLLDQEHNENKENNEKIKTVKINKRCSLPDTGITDLKTESTKNAKRQRKSMNNIPVQYTENNTELNQLIKAENDFLKPNNEIFQISKKSPTSFENTNINVEGSLEMDYSRKNNYTIKKSELLNQNQDDDTMSIKNYLSHEQTLDELSLENLKIDVTDSTMKCNKENIEQTKIKNIGVKESNDKDTEILKHYTDKTIKPFNKLETIFENSKGKTIMGKRKLKRYINFEDVFTEQRRSKRKAKVRKINPSFNMKVLDLYYLQSL